MKKLIYIVLAIIALSTSCSDFLEEDPRSIVSPPVVLSSVEGFDATLRGTYSNILGWGKVYSWNQYFLYESFVDFQYAPHGSDFSAGYILSSSWEVNQGWTNLYSIVNSANLVIDHVGSIEGDPAKDRIEGEAKFLRGWAYFSLVQFFGDVPLVAEPVTDPSNFQPSRTPQAQVYDLIISDLKDAANMMGDDSPELNRVNRWVAKAWLAKAYLTMAGNPNNLTTYQGENTWQLALDQAKDIIESDRYSIDVSFPEVFWTDGDAETIWELRTPGNVSYYNIFTYLSQGILTPTTEFINSFDADDIRGPRWGIRNSFMTAAGDTMTFPLPTYIKLVDTIRYADDVQFQSGMAISAIRYADVLLMAAEAANEVNNGPTADAYQWINDVRMRAGIGELSGLNHETFKDSVFIERRHELYGEGFSWWDMKRFNKWALFNDVTREIRTSIDDHLNYFPIYDVELINNPNVTQNPGWPG